MSYAVTSQGYRDVDRDPNANERRDIHLPDGVLHNDVDIEARRRADSRSSADCGVEPTQRDNVGGNVACGSAAARGTPDCKVRLLLRGCDTGTAHEVGALHQGGGAHDTSCQDHTQDNKGRTRSRIPRVPVRLGGPGRGDSCAEGRQQERNSSSGVITQRRARADPVRSKGVGRCRSPTLAAVPSSMREGGGSCHSGAQHYDELPSALQHHEEEAHFSGRERVVSDPRDLGSTGERLQHTLPCGMGGIPPDLRGLEMQRPGGSSGHTLAHVGASECGEGNARIPELAIVECAPEPISTVSGAHRHRCRRVDCASALRQAKAAAKSAEAQLRRELSNRHNEVAGLVRRALIENRHDDLKRELEVLQSNARALTWQRRSFEVLARKLSEENAELSEALSTEKERVLSMSSEHAAYEKQCAIQSRRAATEARRAREQLEHEMSKRLSEQETKINEREREIREREREIDEREAGVHGSELEVRMAQTRVENRERELGRREAKAAVATQSLRQRMEANACKRAEQAESKANAVAIQAERKAEKAEKQRAQAEERAVDARALAEEKTQVTSHPCCSMYKYERRAHLHLVPACYNRLQEMQKRRRALQSGRRSLPPGAKSVPSRRWHP